ncbi:hypothetical protein Ddye_017869 [Dipteronia dyeriana]|uniref:Uncharacterized protein n=1 Tax=Dipteronia dyeriana TaxID=168575 RepID=A0AAD9UAG7_9ROSI|nr:hypothetical protein Ddye_017869 [Dipteronia dyeriana]
MLILLTLFRKTRDGFKDVKVMDLETFLEKLSASEARNMLPEVGFRGEQKLMQTGNEKSSFPKKQLYKSIKKRHLLSEKLKDYCPLV